MQGLKLSKSMKSSEVTGRRSLPGFSQQAAILKDCSPDLRDGGWIKNVLQHGYPMLSEFSMVAALGAHGRSLAVRDKQRSSFGSRVTT